MLSHHSQKQISNCRFHRLQKCKQQCFFVLRRHAEIFMALPTGCEFMRPRFLQALAQSGIVGATAAKDGYLRPAIEALAAHGAEVFSTWRQPSEVWVTGLPSTLGSLANLGAVVSLDELTSTASAKALEA